MSSSCCDNGPVQNTQELTRSRTPVVRPLDNCNNKSRYLGTNGTDYAFGTLVKFDTANNTVIPATVLGPPDTFEDVIGVSLSTVTADGTKENDLVVAHTGWFRWCDIAESLGYDENDEDQYWQYYTAAVAANIYVEFK